MVIISKLYKCSPSNSIFIEMKIKYISYPKHGIFCIPDKYGPLP